MLKVVDYRAQAWSQIGLRGELAWPYAGKHDVVNCSCD